MNVLKDIIKSDTKVDDTHPAIITPTFTISYSQLSNRIESAAAYLNSLGVKESTKAAVLGSNSHDYIICILALWSLNACVIPLNTLLSDNELSDIIDFSDTEILFYSEDEKRDVSLKIPQIVLTGYSEAAESLKAPRYNFDDISLIMFTSGATGKPKGVMHSLNGLINSADNSQTFLNQSPQDKWLASLPFYHIGGLSIIIRALRYGLTIVIPDSLKNDDLKKSFEELNPTLTSVVSTQLRRLLDSGWKPGNDLRNILLGGGFADEELIKDAVTSGCRISNVYGSTETSAFVAAIDPENIMIKPLSAGKALGSNRLFIADDKLRPVPGGTSGEILIEGNSLFHGYYKDERTTRRKLKDGKFHTGDIGYIDDDGDLFIEARRNDLIITGGENVNPFEVENILNRIPGIKDSCVFPLPDKEWGQIVAAAVVLHKNVSLNDIAGFLKEKISGYKIPKRFFPVEKIPKSSLGKIMREKVRSEIELLL